MISGVLRRLLVTAALAALLAPMLAARSTQQIARADEAKPATYWDDTQGVEIPGELGQSSIQVYVSSVEAHDSRLYARLLEGPGRRLGLW